MDLPKEYRILNQWIPITPKAIPMRKTSNLCQILENNEGAYNNYASMGIVQFSGDELGQVPFRQLLEADDPIEGSFVNSNWVGDGGGSRLGQTNPTENVVSTRFKPNPNVVGDLNLLFSNQEENFNAHFATNQVPLTCVEDVDTCYMPSTCYGYPLNGNTRAGSSNQVEASRPFLENVNRSYLSLGWSNADRRFVESSQDYVIGPIQSSLGPTPQYNSHVSFLPNLNSLPENTIPGTSASMMMTIPPTPLNMEKNQRTMNLNHKPLDIIELESETSSNQIEQHFSNQVEMSPIINSQQREIDRNVVVNLSEEQGKDKIIDSNNTPQPKAKRKKHRPKVVREGKPIRAPRTTTPKPASANESTPRKRKYTRKTNDVDAQVTPTNNIFEKVDHSTQSSNKHVRRSLKFDESQCEDAIKNNVGENQIQAEKNVHAFDLNDSLNQAGSQNVAFAQHSFQYSQNSQHRGIEKGTYDFARMMNGMASSFDNGENVDRLVRMISDRGRKRDYNHHDNSANSLPGSCNYLQKRRRTENAYNSRTSMQNVSDKESTFADIQRIMALQNMQSSKNMMSNQMACGVQAPNTMNCHTVSKNGTHVQASNLINCHNFSSPNTINNGNQVRAPNTMNCNMVSAFSTVTPNAIISHKVPSTPTMDNELSYQQPSSLEIATHVHNNSNRIIGAYGPKARVEALVANKEKLKTRTPRKKENPLVTSKPTNAKKTENIIPITQSTSARIPNIDNYKPSGVLIAYKGPVDALARKLEQLNINDTVDCVMPNPENALVPYANGGGAMVPFEKPLDFLKKKPRPKVNLDPESNRVWKLLMGLEDEEGKDVDKEKWWEEERRVFLGRAQSFIARMELIQGNREFSEWKGSVVDSVIGVFLTQNVSDHLSSSAFMSLAARFPLKPKVDNKTTCLETARSPIIVSEEDCSHVELKKITSDELINSKKSQESNLDFNEVELGLGQKSPDSVLATSVILLNSTSTAEFDGIFSSPNSIDSSQNSSDCPNQAFNASGLNTLSNFEARELLTGSSGNGYNSFTELLQMANDKVLHNPQLPFNNQVDWSNSHGNFLNSDFSGNAYTKQVNSLRKNESTVHVNQIKMNNMIELQVQEEIGKKSTVKIAPKSNKAPKVEVKKKKSSITFDWDSLRRNVCKNPEKKARKLGAVDSLDYEAMRQANVDDISSTIRERGMNNMLAERMKAFLNRLVKDHGSIDLEWLRDVPPEKAKDYLLSIRGLGLKSVECVRLLTLHHLAFPVDTNVGRIAVRLGWVPLQPLPESLQLHLLEMYPMLETIQKYLWPRLCKIDQPTLYQLHYHLITFGKVFCTKSKPNCNSCPMKGECKHFASAFASARLALPGPEEKRIATSSTHLPSSKMYTPIPRHIPLPQLEYSMGPQIQIISRNCEPIIEEPKSPEPECLKSLENDIEDAFYEDPDEIPTIKLNFEEFKQNLQNYMKENNMAIQDGDLSKALVAIDSEAASIPVPKLKNVSRLRTEHLVYELPDTHPLLEGFDQREPDDPSNYLLAIWTPGETAQSIDAPKACSSSPESGKMCGMSTCFSCNSIKETQTQTVRGTILIPCRTANRGSFPLNGTYFQVNEVFADHDSSCTPIDVPRELIWNLQRRTVYFGTSTSSIFKGLTADVITRCFQRGFVCVRGFERTTRSPKPLFARLHFPAGKATKTKKQDKKQDKTIQKTWSS